MCKVSEYLRILLKFYTPYINKDNKITNKHFYKVTFKRICKSHRLCKNAIKEREFCYYYNDDITRMMEYFEMLMGSHKIMMREIDWVLRDSNHQTEILN
jgi:hypothetical protein